MWLLFFYNINETDITPISLDFITLQCYIVVPLKCDVRDCVVVAFRRAAR